MSSTTCTSEIFYFHTTKSKFCEWNKSLITVQVDILCWIIYQSFLWFFLTPRTFNLFTASLILLIPSNTSLLPPAIIKTKIKHHMLSYGQWHSHPEGGKLLLAIVYISLWHISKWPLDFTNMMWRLGWQHTGDFFFFFVLFTVHLVDCAALLVKLWFM